MEQGKIRALAELVATLVPAGAPADALAEGELSDGRQVTCVTWRSASGRAGGVDCDWGAR